MSSEHGAERRHHLAERDPSTRGIDEGRHRVRLGLCRVLGEHVTGIFDAPASIGTPDIVRNEASRKRDAANRCSHSSRDDGAMVAKLHPCSLFGVGKGVAQHAREDDRVKRDEHPPIDTTRQPARPEDRALHHVRTRASSPA